MSETMSENPVSGWGSLEVTHLVDFFPGNLGGLWEMTQPLASNEGSHVLSIQPVATAPKNTGHPTGTGHEKSWNRSSRSTENFQ